MSDEVQRSLGRIEGTQGEILRALKALGDSFADHVQSDQISFSSVRSLVYEQKQDLKTQFEAHAKSRDEHLDQQDIKLNALMTARAVLRGQLTLGQKIFASVGGLALFLWGALQVYLRYHR